MQKNLSRRCFIKAGLMGLVLGGCEIRKKSELIIKNPLESVKQSINTSPAISYKLKDLCDSETGWNDITLNIYIENSPVLWDYNKYKEEIFSYVSEFFRENKINCKIIYSDKQFKKFEKPDEFGIEILDSKKNLNNRYFQLISEQNLIPETNPLLLNNRGYAITRTGISLIDGSWEEFREWIRTGEMTTEEIEKQFLEDYKGLNTKEYILRANAGTICHEIGHCMSLIHSRKFKPTLIDVYYKDMPNIMSYAVPNFKKGNAVGFILIPFQQKLIHSFITGNNNWKAFLDSKRDLDIYIDNIAEANNLKVVEY